MINFIFVYLWINAFLLGVTIMIADKYPATEKKYKAMLYIFIAIFGMIYYIISLFYKRK